MRYRKRFNREMRDRLKRHGTSGDCHSAVEATARTSGKKKNSISSENPREVTKQTNPLVGKRGG